MINLLINVIKVSNVNNSTSTQENKYSLKAGMFLILKAGMGDSKRPIQHLRLALGLECRCSIL